MHEPRFKYATNKQPFRFDMLSHPIPSFNSLSLGSGKSNCDIMVSLLGLGLVLALR